MLTRRRLLETSAVALSGLAVLAGPARAQGAYDMAELLKPGSLPDMSLGRADAPVTVIEYSSMTCGHCAHFHEVVFPYLKSAYIDTGKVRFIAREFPLDPLASAVAMLVRCSPPDRYFELTGMFFEKQTVWAAAADPVLALRTLAKQIGFTPDTFKACLSDQKLLDDLKAVRARGSTTFQIDGTPTFFINGRKIVGISSKEELDQAIAPHLK